MKPKSNSYQRCLMLFAFITLTAHTCFAQIEFTEHTIAENFLGAISVYAVDIDGDGDMDVLGAAAYNSIINWWENDGQQHFTEHTIADRFNAVYSVYAADLDGNGDMDVLGAAINANTITWWENDGEQDFTEHTIAGNFGGAYSVYAADLDGDDDMDVLGAARSANDITWWENDGEQDFTEHTIADNFGNARSVYAADVDGDGDMDVLGAALSASDITWWENDGEQNFTEHTIADDFSGAHSVFAADVDNDGDMDVLGAATSDDIAWWENDGEQEFAEHTITDNFGGAWSVYAADIDCDGDIDVLGAGGGCITLWENDGEQEFTEHTIADDLDLGRCVYAADIDNDTDIDVLGAASNDNEITWWENDLDPFSWLTLPDSGFAEDGSLQLSMEYLYAHIHTPDFPDSVLVISVENSEHVLAEIDEEGLTITAEQDWFGIESLMLIVTDPDENSDTTYQHITVTPVNDLPSAFGLLEPTNNAEIADYPAVTFSWEESVDEVEGDTVTYALVLTFNDDDHVFADIDVTTIEINREDLSIDPNLETAVEWEVWAFDGTDSIFANEPFFLTVAPLSVSEQNAILPSELSLGPIYPNPFNAVTTIRYALPTQSHVTLVVYNLVGQQVASLVDGYKQPGFHNAVLNAADLPSGLYFVRLEAGNKIFTQKMMLIT